MGDRYVVPIICPPMGASSERGVRERSRSTLGLRIVPVEVVVYNDLAEATVLGDTKGCRGSEGRAGDSRGTDVFTLRDGEFSLSRRLWLYKPSQFPTLSSGDDRGGPLPSTRYRSDAIVVGLMDVRSES